jgi:3-hydroxy-3-methylglutaryl CoA synthase
MASMVKRIVCSRTYDAFAAGLHRGDGAGCTPRWNSSQEKLLASQSQKGIKSFGAYVPARRISRAAIASAHSWSFPPTASAAKGERSLCSWDEDAITMAIEAARDCLGGTRATVTALDLASTTAPYSDLQNAVIASCALRLGKSVSCTDHGGSTRAGLSALSRACASGEGDRLVVASDRRSAKPRSAQELQYGCAAGALLVGSGPDLIARFLGSESVSVPFVDHFRHAGEKFDYYWEERWIRDEGVAKIVPGAVTSLLGRLSLSAERVAHFGLAGAPLGSDKLAAKILSISPERVLPDLQAQVGDTGTAHSSLLLIQALERARPGDIIVVAAFAQGCEIVAFEMLESGPRGSRRGLAGSLARRIEETSYLKMLSFDDHVELDWGMRAETDQKTALTQVYRSAEQILGFVGGRCESCQAVQFPLLPTCVNCGAPSFQAPFPLADEAAKVATYTADWLQFSPAPPLYVGLVQFDVGARVLMEIVDVGRNGIDVGTPLQMCFRIKERDRLRHYDRYFWKAVPTILN